MDINNNEEEEGKEEKTVFGIEIDGDVAEVMEMVGLDTLID